MKTTLLALILIFGSHCASSPTCQSRIFVDQERRVTGYVAMGAGCPGLPDLVEN